MSHFINLPNEIIGLVLSIIMMIGVLGIKSIFIDKNLTEIKIKKLLTEKEFMLKEVHHRIKNCMTSTQGLLSLHASTLKEPNAITALEDASSRIKSIKVLYNKLYESPDFMKLSIKTFFTSLVDEILIPFPNYRFVKVEQDIDDIVLETKILQPLGIIVNELLTNIMKYAFKDNNDCKILVSVKRNNDHITLTVGDNGIGIPETVNFEKSSGFGLTLVGALAEQLDGTIKIDRTGGTMMILDFKAPPAHNNN